MSDLSLFISIYLSIYLSVLFLFISLSFFLYLYECINIYQPFLVSISSCSPLSLSLSLFIFYLSIYLSLVKFISP